MYEKHLAHAQLGNLHEVGPHRTGDLGQATGIGELDAGGHRHALTCWRDGELGLPATGQQRAHFVAD